MADREHLHIVLKGGKELERARERLGGRLLDLTEADLSAADLSERRLSMINFDRADLSRAFLAGSTVGDCQFRSAKLERAQLIGSTLLRCDFEGAGLLNANLRGTLIVDSSFNSSRFAVDLVGAVLNNLTVVETDFSGAEAGQTVWSAVNLAPALGLDAVRHTSASTVGLDTVVRSQGRIPESFLRGCGVPDEVIAYVRSLGQSVRPIELYSCFISYSNKDQEFCQRLHNDLQAAGVRCWFAPEDMKIGDRLRDTIETAIRLHDKLLLVLSENSIASSWVEAEVESALEREEREGRLVLFPVRLDGSAMDAPRAWTADVRRRRHVGDFSRWKDHDAYQRAFQRLLRDLRAAGSQPSY